MKKVSFKKEKLSHANVDHIAHQVNVTGVGAHRNKKKTIHRKAKYKKIVND